MQQLNVMRFDKPNADLGWSLHFSVGGNISHAKLSTSGAVYLNLLPRLVLLKFYQGFGSCHPLVPSFLQKIEFSTSFRNSGNLILTSFSHAALLFCCGYAYKSLLAPNSYPYCFWWRVCWSL